MAKNVLSAAKVDVAIKKGGRAVLRDGEGLLLAINGESATWTLRYTSPATGKRREMGLGKHVSLKLARELADAAREQIARGIDPLVQRKADAAAAKTFKAVADETLAIAKQEWTADDAVDKWDRAMDHCKGVWGDPIKDMGPNTVADILKKIEAPTARRFVQLCLRRVFDTAIAQGAYTGHNPADARVAGKLVTLKHKGGHNKAMPWRQVPAYVKWLQSHTAPSARCLEFIIRTGVRKREAIEMRWGEVDFEEAVWTIPAERTKARREHTVPLTAEMVRILKAQRELAYNDYVWPGSKKAPHLSHGAFMHLLDDGMTVHGFRSSLRQYLGDNTSVPWEIAEGVLSHLVGDATVKAYRRGTDLARRREALELWEKHLATWAENGSEANNVIDFKEIANA